MNLPMKLFGNLEDFCRLPHANSNRHFILYVDLGIYLAVHLLNKKKILSNWHIPHNCQCNFRLSVKFHIFVNIQSGTTVFGHKMSRHAEMWCTQFLETQGSHFFS